MTEHWSTADEMAQQRCMHSEESMVANLRVCKPLSLQSVTAAPTPAMAAAGRHGYLLQLPHTRLQTCPLLLHALQLPAQGGIIGG